MHMNEENSLKLNDVWNNRLRLQIQMDQKLEMLMNKNTTANYQFIQKNYVSDFVPKQPDS